jgi:hypothetical protein
MHLLMLRIEFDLLMLRRASGKRRRLIKRGDQVDSRHVGMIVSACCLTEMDGTSRWLRLGVLVIKSERLFFLDLLGYSSLMVVAFS